MNRTREARLRGSFVFGISGIATLPTMAVRRVITALPVAALLLAGVAHADIIIGVAGPFSGQYAGFGNELKAGAEAAAKAVNASGGINGETVTIITGDDACDTKRAVDVAKEFVGKDVRAVVGHFCSGSSLSAAYVYADAGIVMLSPAASNPALTDSKLWNVFRLTGRDDAQADFAANAVKAAGDGVAAVIGDGTPTSAALVNRFVARHTQSPTITIKPGQTDLSDVVAAIADKTYSHVYLATAATDATRIVQALRNGGYAGPLLAADAVVTENFANKAGAAADGLRATFPADPTRNGNATAVIASMVAEGTSSEGAALPAYAAVQAFAAAAKATSVNDGKAMARWLHGNAVATVLGSLTFDAQGDLTAQPFVWYQFNAGSFRLEQN
jgi:branched-chain amino acid transport system substrate-binding protein